MNRGPDLQPQACLSAMSYAARLAIWTLRRIEQGPRPCMADDAEVSWGSAQDLQGVVVLVRAALTEMKQRQAGGLHLGCSGSLSLTRHEQRLLRALAAAQDGDDGRVDNYLYKIALDQRARRHLTTAVTALAAALATAGHWLSDPPPAWRLPAAALPVAELHGRTIGPTEVAWP